MVKKINKSDNNIKRYFYVSLSVSFVVLLISITLFTFALRGGIEVTGEARSRGASNPVLDDFAKFKECLCGDCATSEKPLQTKEPEKKKIPQVDIPQVDASQVDPPQVDFPQVDDSQVDIPSVNSPKVSVSSLPKIFDTGLIEICNNGKDDDKDRDIDCDDTDCWATGWRNVCWDIPNPGDGSYGSECDSNDECDSGFCLYRHFKHEGKLDSFCAEQCDGFSCPSIAGEKMYCAEDLNSAPDIIYLCSSPYGVD